LANRLGYAGLLPFVAGALLVWLVDARAHPYAVQLLASYAALVVAFLGGLHWGLALRAGETAEPRLYVWGVAATLLAWVGALMPPHAGLVVLGVLLAVGYAVDRRVYPRHGLAGWLKLRFRLSSVAAISCFLGAAGT
jgi:hypothetical protein